MVFFFQGRCPVTPLVWTLTMMQNLERHGQTTGGGWIQEKTNETALRVSQRGRFVNSKNTTWLYIFLKLCVVGDRPWEQKLALWSVKR